jgi:hypothetical protein
VYTTHDASILITQKDCNRARALNPSERKIVSAHTIYQ